MRFETLTLSMKYDKVYLDQISDAVRKIETFTVGFDFERFNADEKTQSAVILQLVLIGEIAKRISEKAKAEINLPLCDYYSFFSSDFSSSFGISVASPPES